MNETIHINVTPDQLYLTASRAAEQISQEILNQLPVSQRLKCYGRYLLEPAFIKEHLTSIMQEAPFFIGAVFQIWNYLSSSLKSLESEDTTPPTKENLIRIISIPLDYAEKHTIVISNGRHLPPSLQSVFKLLGRENIDLSEIDDKSIDYAKRLLISTTQNMSMAASAGAAYGKHNQSKNLALSHLKSGHINEGFYYGEQACIQLSQGFSLIETLLTCDALLDLCKSGKDTGKDSILEIKARIKFMLGEYRVALEIYGTLSNSDLMNSRYESMRKVVRCYERLGKYSEAIDIGNNFLPQIKDKYYRAKMQRVLGWTYLQLGETSDIEKALKISDEAKKHFKAVNNNDSLYNLARTYNNLGVAHEQIADKTTADKRSKEFVIAASNHSKCKAIMHKLGSLRWESASLLNLSVVQRKKNQLGKSLKQASEAIRIKTWICDFDDLPICQYNIAFTHLKIYFTDRNPDSLNLALHNINQALKFRNKQCSSKRITPLLCLKAICEIILDPHTIQTETITHLLAVREFHEDDKIPLFHKTLALIHLWQQKPLPSKFNRISEEQELPEPKNILENYS